ncbi:LuxR C-terminal-related transcriptional regulator [bacterium]|nr:LuxR C-terminal-related transcriptional regulator [bacterium]
MSTAKEMPTHHDVVKQTGDLLATKLTVPIMRVSLVRRTRLTDKIIKGMHQRMTLIVAPAGYGKTTLLGEWLATISGTNWKVAWISLDSHDDLPRFWSYVVASLQKIYPTLQFGLHDLYSGECDLQDCMQLNPLINEIAEIPFHFSLVLDDYHEITDEAIHKSLGYFINNLPENCHLILASRIMPPLPISRLRARGWLEEVMAQELSFTLDEAEAFLSHVMNLGIPGDKIISLFKMTEGWIAGLKLAALSLQGQDQTKNIFTLDEFNSRYILDFMTEEVLSHQDAATKDFLLKTSILDELSPSLCDALLGRDDSWKMLQFLEEANLFITPMDEIGQWYRYHQLFSDLLSMQLSRRYGEEIPGLHLAACDWFQKNNFPEKAVPHALKAGENSMAADIVEAYALQTIVQLNVVDLIRWMDHLPKVIVQNRPRLLIYYALAKLILGRAGDLEEYLDKAEDFLKNINSEVLPPEEAARLQRYIGAIRVASVCTKGDFSLGIRSSQEVLDNLLPEDYFFLGLIEHDLAYAYQAAGRFSEGIAAQERACQNALTHGFNREYVLSQSEKARFYRVKGKLRAAKSAYQDAINYALNNRVSIDLHIFPITGLARIYLEWNQFDEVEELLDTTVIDYFRLPNGAPDWFYSIDALLVLARYFRYKKEYGEAARFIQMADKLSRTYQFIPNLFFDVRLAQVELWLDQGDIQAAVNWASRRELQALEQAQPTPLLEKLGLAQVYIAGDDNKKAVSLLTSIVRELEEGEHSEYLLKALILKSIAQWKQGATKPATRAVIRALSMAEPEGIVRSFLDQGQVMQEILEAVEKILDRDSSKERETPDLPAFVHFLIGHFNQSPTTPVGKIRVEPHKMMNEIISPLVEPLSDREREVMILLAQGCSAGDVAKELIISVNTAKAHIKNIYQKLDVHSRKEAIDRAIALQLIV